MRNSISTELKLLIFKNGSVINIFIAINVFCFLLINFIHLGEWATISRNSSFPIESWILKNVSLPANFSSFLAKPWTLISYIFIHQDVFHILFNMVWLYFIGKIFEEYLGEKKFSFVFLSGGIAGGLLFLGLYRIIPALHDFAVQATLIGASAGVMAVIVSTATLIPNYSIFLIFIGSIPLKWIAIIYVVLDLIQIPYGNAGGHISHLGGALFGFLYVRQLNRGNDWSKPFMKWFERKPKTHLKVVSHILKTPPLVEKDREQMVNEILEKISKTGYKSLSEKEKLILTKASQDI
jgi:membrane associated rhomboid family serine protease